MFITFFDYALSWRSATVPKFNRESFKITFEAPRQKLYHVVTPHGRFTIVTIQGEPRTRARWVIQRMTRQKILTLLYFLWRNTLVAVLSVLFFFESIPSDLHWVCILILKRNKFSEKQI